MAKNTMLKYSNEILSDNSKNYEQCKGCMHIDSDNAFMNRYNKGYCLMFPYPESGKPTNICVGKEKCEYYEKRED